jgi:hypothetical protein
VRKEWIIPYNSRKKEIWDWSILVMAIENSFVIPLEVAFEPAFESNLGYQIISNLIDLMFLIDMVLISVTAYIDSKGNQVKDSNLIIKHYVKSFRFIADFGALLGTGIITNLVPSFKFFGFFKLTRIFRIGAAVGRSNMPSHIKMVLNILKLTIYLVMYFHVVGCFWFSVVHVSADQFDHDGRTLQWYPPIHFLNYADSDIFNPQKDQLSLYFLMVYYSVLMGSLNEMGPVNPIEMASCTLIMLGGCFVNAQIFSEIAVLIQSLQKSSQEFQKKIDNANSSMNNLKIDEHL